MMASDQRVDPQGMLAAANLLSRPADEFGNDPSLEMMWAQHTFHHAEVYFNILCSCDPRLLKLTQYDDDIYRIFRKDFPTLKVDVVNEEEMKSPDGKQLWRAFCEKFKNIDDHSYGTLLRVDSNKDYTEDNSIIVARIQFYAIEIARNREGYNDFLRNQFCPPPPT